MKKYKYDIGTKISIKSAGGFVGEIVGKVDNHYKVRILFIQDRIVQLPVDYVHDFCELYVENEEMAEVHSIVQEPIIENERMRQKRVITELLKQGPQTRETLADAISVFSEQKDILKLKSHVSAVLGQLKNEDIGLITLERGKYIIDSNIKISEKPNLGVLVMADKVSRAAMISLLEKSLLSGEKTIDELAEEVTKALPEKQLEVKKLKQYISVAIRSMQKKGINVVRCGRGKYKLEKEVTNGSNC